MNRFQLLASASVVAVLVGRGAAPAEAAQAAEAAGSAIASIPSVEALLEGSSPRSIAIGNTVFRDERVSTGPDGHLHILFLDDSNLTLGPSSNLVIDEFVYDPDTGEGNVSLNLADGVLRFVGGAISKTNEVRIGTTVGTIGIRGGVALVRYLPDGGIQAFFVFGDVMSATNNAGETVTAQEPGFSIIIRPDGTIEGPLEIDPGALAETVNLLDTVRGGARQAEVPDAVLDNFRDRLERQPIDPETALRHTNAKFTRRFHYIEDRMAAEGRRLEESTLEEMDALWTQAKLESPPPRR